MSIEGAPRVDLHVHTNRSDGSLSPLEILETAYDKGVTVLSITDHDTLDAYTDNVFERAKQLDIYLISGIEISTVATDGVRWHILGYGVDTEAEPLKEFLNVMRNDRVDYASRVVKLLRANNLDPDSDSYANNAIVSKATIADAVIDNPNNANVLVGLFGRVPNRGEFIEATMNEGGFAHQVRTDAPTPEQAIAKIHEAGGLAVLAHPVAAMYEQGVSLGQIKELLLSNNFDGLEALYIYYHKAGGDVLYDQSARFTALANELGLVATRGSDFHGRDKKVGKFIEIGLSGRKINMKTEDLNTLGVQS